MTDTDFLKENAAYYDRNAYRYEAASWYYFNRYKNDMVRRELATCLGALRQRDALHILEIGPGTGYLLERLLPHNPPPIYFSGIEHSAAMRDILTERYAGQCASFEVAIDSVSAGQLRELGRSGEFDLVMGSSILHHLPDYKEVVPLLGDKLAPGGVMYLVREPILRAEVVEAGTLKNILEVLYNRVAHFYMKPSIRARLWPGKVKAEDARPIAIHMFKDGVSTQPFQQLIADQHYQKLFHRKYNRRPSAFFSYVENEWLKGLRKDIYGNTLFAMGVQKPNKEALSS